MESNENKLDEITSIPEKFLFKNIDITDENFVNLIKAFREYSYKEFQVLFVRQLFLVNESYKNDLSKMKVFLEWLDKDGIMDILLPNINKETKWKKIWRTLKK